MSRIQDILKKAEREGGVHRTRALVVDAPPPGGATAPPSAGSSASRAVAGPATYLPAGRAPAPRDLHDTVPLGQIRQAEGSLDRRLVAAHASQSLAAEQFRSLRTRIKAAENGSPQRVIIVTSPNTGDGKSLTAANLALTMAQEFQQRVVLLDADLRRPAIHHMFGLDETPGLSDVLMGGSTVENALVELPEYNLAVLPSGLVPVHPAELLGSTGMRRVIDTLRTHFDRIILDMPPVAPLADVSITAEMADGVLMIVRAGVTPKPAIERALAGLEMSKVLGLVLNDAGDPGRYGDGSYAYAGYAAG